MKSHIALLLFVVVFVVSGCASIKRLVNDQGLAAQLAVEAATARVLDRHPSWTGQTIVITGEAMRMIAAGTVMDLRSVEAHIKARIRWQSMLPEEQALVSALISAAVDDLDKMFRERGVDKPELRLVEVNKVLGWINETAKRRVK